MVSACGRRTVGKTETSILKHTVAIFQPRLLHYRTALFEQLREVCAADGIRIELVCGQAVGRERSKKDEAHLPWATMVRNRYVEVAGKAVLWQPFPENLRQCDLAIVMQESRIISNYPLQASRKFRGTKVAYWGHGKNFFTKSPGGIRDKWKNWLINKVDWWFAYTDIVVDILEEAGYPAANITCLNNAIDNSKLKQDLASVDDNDLRLARERLDIPHAGPVGIFCGSFYPEKKLDFLVASADRIHQHEPEFRMIVIGAGPSAAIIEEAAEERPWLHYVGKQMGKEKAIYFRLADFMLNPGTVGLHIVDAFCAGLVMVTTQGAHHSPEIAYLDSGRNGLMVEATVESYANAVMSMIRNSSDADALKQAALQSSDEYTLPKMVENFSRGIHRALAS